MLKVKNEYGNGKQYAVSIEVNYRPLFIALGRDSRPVSSSEEDLNAAIELMGGVEDILTIRRAAVLCGWKAYWYLNTCFR